MIFRFLLLSVSFFISGNIFAIDIHHSVVDVHQSPDVRAVVLSSYGQYEVTEIRVGNKVLGTYHVSKRSNCHLSHHINGMIESAKTHAKLIRFKFADGISYGSCAGAISDGLKLTHNPHPVRAVAGLEEMEAQLANCQQRLRDLTHTGVRVNRAFEDDLLRRVKEMHPKRHSTNSRDAN